MRAGGLAGRASGTARRHACWSYDDWAEFAAAVGTFLADGLASGLRVWYMAVDPDDGVAAQVLGFDDARRRGSARVSSVPTGHPAGVIDPVALVETYARATADALAAGYAGLRVATDVTPLVRTAGQVDAVARYERLIDAYMVANPFTALCAYDRRQVDPWDLAQLACLHPETNDVSTQFRLHACRPELGAAALAGEVDIAARELFPLALRRVQPAVRDGRVVVDATDLNFIDHRGLLALGAYARDRGAVAVLRTSSSVTARVIEMLGLPDVRTEPVP
jgi:anti-anti-sigma regulatory factor